MYQSTKYENPQGLEFTLPWDKVTAKSWGIALVSLSLIMLFLSFFGMTMPEPIKEDERPSLVILNFGDGDGTGKSSGNLQEEGRSSRANNVTNNLEDAQRSAETKATKVESNATIDESNNIKPVNKIETKTKEKTKAGGTDKKNVGVSTAEDDLFAHGLGDMGRGTGAGQGIGDIDWGGGGNRKVINKPLPEYPPGVRASSKIVLQIRVMPDGTVSNVVSKIKGDPRLENAAIAALRRWKFNPIDSNVVMIGEVPLTFAIR